MNKNPESVDEYIQNFPKDVQKILEKIRLLIRENAPGVIEGISYRMPAYKWNKKALVYFAAYTNHIGFYATPTGHAKFKERLSSYKQGKGSVQFPLDKEIPYKLIAEIVKFRYNENNGI